MVTEFFIYSFLKENKLVNGDKSKEGGVQFCDPKNINILEKIIPSIQPKSGAQ